MFRRPIASFAILVAAASAAGCGVGNPPRIENIEDQIAVVGKQLTVWVIASDPEGDDLDYDFAAPTLLFAEQTARMAVGANGQGLFTFTPRADQIGEHYVDFIASDADGEDRLTVRIEVRSAAGAEGAPIFRRPLGSGTVVDLGMVSCAEVEVEVEDADSTEITLRAEPALEGAELSTASNGLTGRWQWCPTPPQRLASARHDLRLVADDGDSPPVEKDFIVMLRPADPGECASEPPTVIHTPEDISTLLDVELFVRVTDDEGIQGTPFALYSTSDPGDPPDYASMSLAAFSPLGGSATDGTWRTYIPNPAVTGGVGSTARLYYLVSVVDQTGCAVDHPQAGLHTITVENPGGPGAAECEPCSFDVQCGSSSDLCLEQEGGSACGTGCSTADDCPTGYVCSATELTSVEGAKGRQCIPVTGTCASTQPCEDDAFEPNDTIAAALAQPTLPVGSQSGLALCPDNDDWYPIVLSSRTKVSAQLSGPTSPDLDLALTNDGGTVLAGSDGPTSQESLTSPCLEPGLYLLRTFSIFADFGEAATYSLGYTLDPNGC